MKKEKQNYLAAAEMDEEGNYNMIDGIINNIPKPSLLEKIKEYERHIAKNEDNAKSKELELCHSSGEKEL